MESARLNKIFAQKMSKPSSLTLGQYTQYRQYHNLLFTIYMNFQAENISPSPPLSCLLGEHPLLSLPCTPDVIFPRRTSPGYLTSPVHLHVNITGMNLLRIRVSYYKTETTS